MRPLITVFVLLCLTPLLFGQQVIEKIEIIGNDKVTRETVLYYLSSKEGDPYDEDSLRRDFRVLWSTGFFANITIEADPGENGKIVRIIVEENPIVKDVTFRTGKAVKEDDIVNKLKEKDSYILPHSYFNPSKIERVKQTIEGLLQEKGLAGGDVIAHIDKKGENEVGVLFQVKEGSRMKVAEVIFEGSPRLHDQALLAAMKENKKHGLLSWITGKDTFKENKLSEDLASLKKKLQENGYMEASVGEPRIEETTKRTIFQKKQRMKKVIIPIQAGERYSLGEVTIEGNKIIPSEYLRSLMKFKEGDVYKAGIREKAVEKIGELYRNFGHLYAQVIPVENLDPKGKRVHVALTIYEGEVAYLNRLEFKGNTYTKDKAMRRELLLREGDRFSLELFKDSVLRLKQLGLVDVEKEPEIKPDPDDPTRIDVTLNIKELQRNNIQFSAGYSGYEGAFISMSYSTVNFLGMGENLEVMAQYGKRIKNYLFSYTQPYVFDRPLNAGLSVYNRYFYYPGLYSQEARGINYNLAFRIKGFWRSTLTYGFEYLDIGAAPAEDDEETIVYNPYYYGGTYGYGNYYVGSLSTSIYRSTVNSPLTPSRGTMYLVGCKVSGGILGGEISLIKPHFEWTFYHPVIKNHSLGLHVDYQFIKPLKGSEVPFWERFYLGGERSIRGYEIYSIGPRDDDGVIRGGEKSLVFNAEYIIPVGGPLYAIFFCDLGNAFAQDKKISFSDLCSSSGLEMRIFVPALRVPLRLIFAYNSPKISSSDSHFAFRFALGTSF
ncbi:MAG: outer membrane protein assembly factor BamA [Clostridiales bacterium]|nr:outer membrane protein assembly factor BamA [Clostridiales bacterium]